MAAGEAGDHGHSVVLPTVYKKRGLGRERERAQAPLHGEMDLTVKEKTPTRRRVVGTC